MRRLASRIGYFRVAALFVLGALICDSLARQVLTAGSAASVAARVASIAFFVAAMVPFVVALREREAQEGRDPPGRGS